MTNSQNKRYVIETAEPEDAPELLEIIEREPFPGGISLLFTRRPDPYESFKGDGAEVNLIICRDQSEEKVVGFGVSALNKMYVNGEIRNVVYISGLRSRHEYRHKLPLIKAYEYLYSLYENRGIDYYLTTILGGNTEGINLFEKKRRSLPYYDYVTDYNVFAIRTGRKPRPQSNLHFRRAREADAPAIAGLLRDEGKRHQFFPAVAEDDIRNATAYVPDINDFFVVENTQGQIVGAAAAWDQSDYKQYIVNSYGGVFKLLYPISRLFPVVGYPRLPAPGSKLKFYTVSYWAVKDGDPDMLRYLVDSIAASQPDFPFYLIGVSATNPVTRAVTKSRHIKYTSRIYMVNRDRKGNLADELDPSRPVYLECGLL